jgi:peptidyl-prolyl cis-trans isomerase C
VSAPLRNDLVTVESEGERSSAGAPEEAMRFSRWLREPLMLFLIVGVALFGLFRAVQPEAFNRGATNRIVLTQDDLRQMSVQWLAQGRPPLAPEQWRSLIEAKVREEVLFREAVALGLDRDDTIVKRRMVQKMEFLAQDIAAAREPSSAELRNWFHENTPRFAQPPRVSFRHLYFSFDKRGQRSRGVAPPCGTGDELRDRHTGGVLVHRARLGIYGVTIGAEDDRS